MVSQLNPGTTEVQSYLIPISLEEFKSRLNKLDLDPIITKLMDNEEGEGWTLEYADDRCADYKRFLLLSFMFPSHDFVPTHDIDCVWHRHVMDTEKYNSDCEMLFSVWYQKLFVNIVRPFLKPLGIRINAGLFFDHFPYFGMRGDEDRTNLTKGYIMTQEYFDTYFGVSIIPTDASKCIKSCHWCKSKSWIERPRPLRAFSH